MKQLGVCENRLNPIVPSLVLLIIIPFLNGYFRQTQCFGKHVGRLVNYSIILNPIGSTVSMFHRLMTGDLSKKTQISDIFSNILITPT